MMASRLKSLAVLLAGVAAFMQLGQAACRAEFSPVRARAPEPEAWVGQRVAFFIELRAAGPFAGAASFSLPQVPRCVIVKCGSPVVESEEVDDETLFVQTHEFALFSQADGAIELPGFEVRFSSRKGFVGPEVEHVERTEALTFEIARPAGGDAKRFLVTTAEIEVAESWEPTPGAVQQGAVFRRTITQHADQTTGMALPPPPTRAPDGVRVHVGRPEVVDKTERGSFHGLRRDTLTYVLREPGTVTIPAIEYVWWNPEDEEFGSKVLPAVRFEVTAAPQPPASEAATRHPWWWAITGAVVAALGGVLYRVRDRLVDWARRAHRWLNPPEHQAQRALLSACRQNDASAAEAAWISWQSLQPEAYEPSSELQSAATDLHRSLYGPIPGTAWRGDALRRALSKRHADAPSTRSAGDDLPALNP